MSTGPVTKKISSVRMQMQNVVDNFLIVSNTIMNPNWTFLLENWYVVNIINDIVIVTTIINYRSTEEVYMMHNK